MHPWMSCKKLSWMLHQAEKWIQDRFVIQDFCLPETVATEFLLQILDDPAIFPMWVCPIKGTSTPQIFAPNQLTDGRKEGYFINFGLYGLPNQSAPIAWITKHLEKKTNDLGGRKVLYSRTYYTIDEFWKIYPRQAYEALRQRTAANGTWHEITDKVLSS